MSETGRCQNGYRHSFWADRPAHSLTVHHDFLLANAKAQANVLVTEDDDSLAMNTVNVIQS